MKKICENLFVSFIFLFSFLVLIELGVNYFSFKYLFPIKNDTSYGYAERNTQDIIIPLDKYSSRHFAQLALPYEWAKHKLQNKKLIPAFDFEIKKYGYVDKNGKVIIDYMFTYAGDFESEFAIVSLDNISFGAIDKNGNWVIKPKYSHICSLKNYYTRACLDDEHCGVIDKFGNEITLLTYSISKLNCNDSSCRKKLCTLKDKNDASCN